jgi:ribosomal protein S18 acetylase RimI-like enzyme
LHRVSLGEIGIEERDALFEMAVRFWKELMPHAPVVQDPSIRARYFEHEFRLGEPGHRAWWALVDDLPAAKEQRVGFAHLELDEDWAGRPWAYVKGFYVVPRWRRQGIGRAFAIEIARTLRTLDVYRIDLHARSDAPASLAFWRAVGYDLASYRLRYYLG